MLSYSIQIVALFHPIWLLKRDHLNISSMLQSPSADLTTYWALQNRRRNKERVLCIVQTVAQFIFIRMGSEVGNNAIAALSVTAKTLR